MKYQVRIGSAWKSLTIADDVPTNNNQLSNGAGYLTSVPAPTSTFTMTSNGSSDYVFAQDSRYFPLAAESDPVLYVRRGETYNFVNNSGGSHPFQIRTSNGGGAYNTGVTNNGAASGTISWTVPMTAPNSVYYQCTAHSNMGNTINIVT
jgi:plastocyanin